MKYLLAAVLSCIASAAPAQGVQVQGVGNLSCGEYLQLREKKAPGQNAVLASWIWGYMAGFNMEVRRPTTRPLPDEASTLAYVDKYCRENPLNSVIEATGALVLELGGKRNPQ